MGACVSRPDNCVGGKFRGARRKKNRKRRKASLKKRVPSHLSDRSSDIVEKFASLPVDHPFTNPTFHGSFEEAWFDSAAVLESDWSDEDFQSIPDDVISVSGFDGTAVSGSVEHLENSSSANSARNSLSGAARSSVHPSDYDFKVKSDEPINGKKPVFVDEISCSAGETGGGDDGLLNNCGILPNNCLPCLASTVPIEKRRSLSSSPPSMRKKAATKLPFKWKEGNPAANFLSSKPLLQRPIAGSQVPFCPLGKRVPDTWSDVEPGTFRVRGVNYLRDKRKEFAPNCAAYYPFGLDVFLSQRKINHIGRFVELPLINSSGKLPPILVVNVQIPLYPAAIFQGETDGEGISFVLYFKLSESFAKDLPAHFQKILRSLYNAFLRPQRLIDDEVEKVKGFRTDTVVPFRERLKILGRVVNVDDLPMSAAERKLMHAYNEKPVLSRPQHEFYAGENYFEIDLDMHRFSYISRKGFETFLDRVTKLKSCQSRFYCCIRLNEIDYVNYQQLGFCEETLE
ncbi:UNVERIFIED_CONTAM: hypothetical protein Sangu_1799200 [Sesamum angustifolium]|uniref:Protein ENHANCED DISEASE RESISTANCE 2 C-terminal domain-containing protein n=1 Tax=Sesamum angustifolium TaxID=2727405 RepID=A0AAW2M6V7_9LAMI